MTDSAHGAESAGPLSGITALDLGRIYLGPWAGLLLALAGADVVKVEPPGGEPARRGASATVPFALLNSNKRSITLDLAHPQGRDVFLGLSARADVVVENWRPGVMDRWGLGPDALCARNPRLVYGAATGFGTEGPERDRLAMDLTVQAYTGVMSVTGFADQPPVKAGAAFIDFLGGAHLYAGIVSALYRRERTGRGGVVDVAMVDTVYPALASSLGSLFRDGIAPRTGNRHGGQSLAPYNVYPATDGQVAILCVTEQHWRRLAAAMGQPELAEDERFVTNGRRVRHLGVVDDLVAAWTLAHPRDEVVRVCQEHRIPAAEVRDVAEFARDPHMHERGALRTIVHPDLGELVVPHTPLRFRGTPLQPLVPAPALGAHNEEVYREWLGFDSRHLDDLRAAGAI